MMPEAAAPAVTFVVIVSPWPTVTVVGLTVVVWTVKPVVAGATGAAWTVNVAAELFHAYAVPQVLLTTPSFSASVFGVEIAVRFQVYDRVAPALKVWLL